MDVPFLVLLVGFLYTLFFGGLSFLRREPVSGQFALEGIAITVLTASITAIFDVNLHPILFLIVIYLITMRAWILMDLGTFYARRGKYRLAGFIYNLANHLRSDRTSRLTLRINQAVMLLKTGNLDDAITHFREVLVEKNQPYLGEKYEAAAHYNLAVAYHQKGEETQAIIEFNTVVDAWPATIYARQAEAALRREPSNGSNP